MTGRDIGFALAVITITLAGTYGICLALLEALFDITGAIQ